jgi:hypothetical protein
MTQNNILKFDTSYVEQSVYVEKARLYSVWCNIQIKDKVVSMGCYFSLLFRPTIMKWERSIVECWTVLTLQESVNGQRSHILKSVPQIFMLDC